MLYNREFENELKEKAKEVANKVEKAINDNVSVTITDEMMASVYDRHPEILETIEEFQYSDESIRKMVSSVSNAIIKTVDFDSLMKISAVRWYASCLSIDPERIRSFLRKYVRSTIAQSDIEQRKQKVKENITKKEVFRRAVEITMFDGTIGYDEALNSAVELVLDDEKMEVQTNIIMDRVVRLIRDNINPFITWALEHDVMITEEIEAYKYRQKTFKQNVGDFKELLQLRKMETQLFGIFISFADGGGNTIQTITEVIQNFLNVRIGAEKKIETKVKNDGIENEEDKVVK